MVSRINSGCHHFRSSPSAQCSTAGIFGCYDNAVTSSASSSWSTFVAAACLLHGMSGMRPGWTRSPVVQMIDYDVVFMKIKYVDQTLRSSSVFGARRGRASCMLTLSACKHHIAVFSPSVLYSATDDSETSFDQFFYILHISSHSSQVQ